MNRVSLSPRSNVQTCKQTAQILNSTSAAFSDITGLAFPVFANRRYWFEFMVTFQTVITTTGIGFTCSAPALTAGNWWGSIQFAASGSDAFFQQQSTTLGTLLSTAVPVADTNYLARLEGFFEPSADGTLQLRCRTEVDTSQVTVQNTGIGLLIDGG